VTGSITRVAAFDVDGTLTTRDCVVPFMRRVAGTPRLVGGMLRSPGGLVSAAARRDRDALKAASASAAFAGRDVVQVQAEADAFAHSVFADRLRSEVLASMRAHQRAGETVVLVSASYELYLRPLAGLLGADDVLAVRLEVEGGQLTGRLDGPNCRGPEKVRRLHEWLDLHAGGRRAVHVTAYGDAAGDRELLGDADVAHWVGSGSMPSS
jgi:phosphatidylglycerophosphatase C